MKVTPKRIASIVLSVCVLSTVQNTGFAEDISTVPNVSYDRIEGTVLMNGYTLSENELVTIEILYPDKSIEDLETLNVTENEIKVGEVVRYLTQVVSDENNYWEKSFYFDGSSGSYPVRVYLTDERKLYTDTLEFVNAAEVQRIIEKINDDSSKTEEIIEGNISVLGLDTPLYLLVKSGASLTKGYEMVASGSPYENIVDLEADFEENMIIGAFNSGIDSQIAAQIFTKYSDMFGITTEKVYEDFCELADLDKSKLCSALDGEGYNTLLDIAEDFKKKAVLCVLNNISEWNRIASVAKEYQNSYSDKITCLRDLNLAGYSALSGERQYNAMKEFKASSADSIEAWVNQFNTVVTKWANTNIVSQGTSGSGGSGSGGKGWSSGVDYMSDVVQQLESGAGVTFTDLDNAPWAKEAIISLADKGIVSGKGDNYFDTASNVTRAEFVKMLVSAFDLLEENAVSGFTDAEENAWYYKYLASAEKNGIVAGNDDGSFGVSKSITRQEMAAMLYRTIKLRGVEVELVNEKTGFTDADKISDWAKEAVYTLGQAGIINGMEDGSFAPLEYTTRAQAAMVIYMTMQKG